MSYVAKGQFYNNSEQIVKYTEMINNLKRYKDDKDNFLDNKNSLKVNSEDNDMFFAYQFAKTGKTLRETRLKLIGNSSNNTCLEENLNMLSKELFPITGYLDRIIDANNSYYKEFNHPELNDDNPWLIDKDKENVMTAEFGLTLGYNSRIELIAKNMLWVNRETKELEIIRKHIVENRAGDRKKCYAYGKKFESIISKILQNQIEFGGQALFFDFLDKYTSFVHGDINKKLLKKSGSYRLIESMKTKESDDITMDDIYKYLSLSLTESSLYQMKNRFVELAVKEFSELKKSKKLNGVQMCRTTDESSNSNTYNTRLQIVIPGYSSPFTVHANDTHLTDLENKYNVKYDNKDLHNPCLSVCVYKYNNRQIDKIHSLTKVSIPNSRIRRCVQYANDRCKDFNNYER